MFGLGLPELLIILAICLLLFGATRLPALGQGMAKGIKNFRKTYREPDEIDVTPKESEPPVYSHSEA
ncbi:MAG: twin-arginine translocase TatA/TatE family subunit [Nitrospinae bacterium]|nr:twin-arginine translocase TatA/TatE family subunit [Nitrospinota bacterium]